MAKPKLPRARFSLIFPLCVACMIFFLWNYVGWRLQDTILAAGLSLDIIGASILAIPDIPTIHRHFFSGMVRSAVDHLELEGGAKESILVEPDVNEKNMKSMYIVEEVSGEAVGQSDLLENVIQAPEPSTEGFYELRKAFYEGTNDSIWNHVFGFKVFEKEGIWRTYVMYDKGNGPKVKLKANYKNPFARVKKKLRDSDARFRRMGLSLLITGFLFQGILIFI